MMQDLRISKNNINHLIKRGLPPFSHSNTSLALENVLIHPVEKTHVLVVKVDLIWLLFLNILSFNFAQMPNKDSEDLEEPMYRVLMSFKPITVKVFIVTTFLFLQLFVPNFSAFA